MERTFHDIDGLLSIFTIDSKSDLDSHCRSLVIHKSDFAWFITACMAGIWPFRHQILVRDLMPEHLEPTDEEYEALNQHSGPGPLEGKAHKFMSKTAQAFSDRRYLVAHLFYYPPTPLWHFFYFDQRDTSRRANHWQHGSHIHLINFLWPRVDPNALVATFQTSPNPRFRKSLHIRHADD
jgi:hypothetical protein